MFHFDNLDETTRRYMLQELACDRAHDALYLSPRLNDAGKAAFPALLEEALRRYDAEWLAEQLRRHDYLKPYEERRRREGEPRPARVPVTAAETLAAGEFNRFYMRGLCLRAVAEGVKVVEVYRGRPVTRPRPESEALIGQILPAQTLLEDLRTWPTSEPVLGIPPGYNSGLTVRLPVTHPTG